MVLAAEQIASIGKVLQQSATFDKFWSEIKIN